MIKKICDRCKREETTKDRERFGYFAKVLSYDFCTKCQCDFMKMIEEFVNNKNQTEVNPNEQEKASNT